jgi:hypothetical protein
MLGQRLSTKLSKRLSKIRRGGWNVMIAPAEILWWDDLDGGPCRRQGRFSSASILQLLHGGLPPKINQLSASPKCSMCLGIVSMDSIEAQ